MFDKYDVIDNDKTILNQIVTNGVPEKNNMENNFNINKHLAYKYFSMAAM